MLRLLATRRWIGWVVFLVLYMAACAALGMWQWDRRDQAQTAIARLDGNWSAPSTPVAEALPDPAGYDPDQQWQRVELEGRYLADRALLMRGRMNSGSVGFQQVVPFLTDQDTVFYVDRGWVPVSPETNEQPEWVPDIPDGEVSVLARLRENEGKFRDRDAPEGQIYSVDLPAFADGYQQTVYTGAYGLLESEDGAVPDDLRLQERPLLDEGPHLSYALQWGVFAIIGVAGFIYGLRQEHLHQKGEPRPPRRKRQDEEEEDALLESL